MLPETLFEKNCMTKGWMHRHPALLLLRDFAPELSAHAALQQAHAALQANATEFSKQLRGGGASFAAAILCALGLALLLAC